VVAPEYSITQGHRGDINFLQEPTPINSYLHGVDEKPKGRPMVDAKRYIYHQRLKLKCNFKYLI